MNVLEIVARACNLIGIPAPMTLVGTLNTTDAQLRAILYDVSTYLRNQRIFTQMKRTHIFTLEANRQFYPLPQDFFAAIMGTQYDDTTKFPLIGPLTDMQFDVREYGIAGFTPFPAFRIFGPDANPYSAGGQFQVWPEPTAAGDTLSFEYQSSSIFKPQNWTPSTAYTQTSPVDYVNANGNNYKCTTSGTSSSTTAPTGQSTTPVANGTAAFAYVPQSYDTILQDEDLSVFDEDLVIAGYKAWYYTAKGQPQADAAMGQFGKMIDSSKSRYYGSYIGRMGRRRRNGYWGISPAGSWDLSQGIRMANSGYYPAPGAQNAGAYPKVGPNYLKYGEQPGWVYSPRDDKYYRY